MAGTDKKDMLIPVPDIGIINNKGSHTEISVGKIQAEQNETKKLLIDAEDITDKINQSSEKIEKQQNCHL